MKIFEKELSNINIYEQLSLHINSDSFIFFDIETTGFSPANSMLYLIGSVSYKNSKYVMTQWFCEGLSDELSVLKSFFSYISDFDTLISFNGDCFDLKYLKSCADKYCLDFAPKRLKSFDLYKSLRPLKNLLGLKNLKQKSLEKFLNIDREDLYTGGELIQVYKEWLLDRDCKKMDMLLLHNCCDLEGMLDISFLLAYNDIFDTDFEFISFSKDLDFIELKFISRVSLPLPLILKQGQSTFHMNKNNISLKLELSDTCLKHYFSDYTNYFYLPEEDSSIHKSLAVFVEKTKRIKAKKDSAFIKSSSTFLQVFGTVDTTIFKKDFLSEEYYILSQDFVPEKMSVNILIGFLSKFKPFK